MQELQQNFFKVPPGDAAGGAFRSVAMSEAEDCLYRTRRSPGPAGYCDRPGDVAGGGCGDVAGGGVPYNGNMMMLPSPHPHTAASVSHGAAMWDGDCDGSLSRQSSGEISVPQDSFVKQVSMHSQPPNEQQMYQVMVMQPCDQSNGQMLMPIMQVPMAPGAQLVAVPMQGDQGNATNCGQQQMMVMSPQQAEQHNQHNRQVERHQAFQQRPDLLGDGMVGAPSNLSRFSSDGSAGLQVPPDFYQQFGLENANPETMQAVLADLYKAKLQNRQPRQPQPQQQAQQQAQPSQQSKQNRQQAMNAKQFASSAQKQTKSGSEPKQSNEGGQRPIPVDQQQLLQQLEHWRKLVLDQIQEVWEKPSGNGKGQGSRPDEEKQRSGGPGGGRGRKIALSEQHMPTSMPGLTAENLQQAHKLELQQLVHPGKGKQVRKPFEPGLVCGSAMKPTKSMWIGPDARRTAQVKGGLQHQVGRGSASPAEEVYAGAVDTMKAQLQILQKEDPTRVFIARRINKLGFQSVQLLADYFQRYGVVKSVHVSHSRVKSLRSGLQKKYQATKDQQWRLRAAALGFVVMDDVEATCKILRDGPEHVVGGHTVIVNVFHRRTDLPGAEDDGFGGYADFEEEEDDGIAYRQDTLAGYQANDFQGGNFFNQMCSERVQNMQPGQQQHQQQQRQQQPPQQMQQAQQQNQQQQQLQQMQQMQQQQQQVQQMLVYNNFFNGSQQFSEQELCSAMPDQYED